jgi:hypothetical protein
MGHLNLCVILVIDLIKLFLDLIHADRTVRNDNNISVKVIEDPVIVNISHFDHF